MPKIFYEEWLKTFVLVVVTVIWAFSFIVDVFSQNFTVPTEVHLIMGSVVGYFIGSKIKEKL